MASTLYDSLLVAAGAAVGANARYWIGIASKAGAGAFPWPTLLINVLGSAALGAFAASSLPRGQEHSWRLFFAVGLCGGFTTFSAFSLESLTLMQERSWRTALLYVLASVVLCIGGCFAGGVVARKWTTPPPVDRAP